MSKYGSVRIQDFALANFLGLCEKEVEQLDLFSKKCGMQRKAFEMKENGVTLTQEEADCLNKEYREIIDDLTLLELGYDETEDYYIDFNSFVVSNEMYNSFCW